MAFRLVSADGNITFELRTGMPMILGRALNSDLPVLDPTISRRHAEILAEHESVSVRDLGSSNGTFVDGERVSATRLVAGSRITFGKVPFELRELSPLLIDDQSAEHMRRAARAGTTIIRQVPVPDAEQALERALRASGVQRAVDETRPTMSQQERDRLKLTLLLEISKALTRTADVESLLDKMVSFTFRLLDVDHVSVLLFDERGTLQPRVGRSRSGRSVMREIAPSLVETVVAQKVAVLSDSAESQRPTPVGGRGGGTPSASGANAASAETPGAREAMGAGASRSAACAPLVASEGRVLGVLYVDSLDTATRVSDEDLDFLVSFAGIGAVALDNIGFGERIRREALVRGNFERFFTPHLAARIASTRDSLGGGGERRRVAVLFSDIRGFTALAAEMTPDATARLLTEYFTEMVDCVFRHVGTLDKFIGDGLMAQWGAPIAGPDDADRALDAALDMLRATEELNRRWRAEARPEIQVGIGLNYGEAFAGFLGSERRLEYTVIGDTVNTARRICDWAEGGEVLLSASLHAALTRPFELGERPPLQLRGKADPVPVFRARP